MRIKLLVSIICIAALLAGCGNVVAEEISDTAAAEVTENVRTEETTVAVNESEDEETVSVMAAEIASETENDALFTRMDKIKEALRTNWDGSTGHISLYSADLNGDGTDELFVSSLLETGETGYTYIYDISEEPALLGELGLRMNKKDGTLYKDSEDDIHFVAMDDCNGMTFIYDLSYNNGTAEIKVPFGSIRSGYRLVYTDNKYVYPSADSEHFNVNFNEYQGKYDSNGVRKDISGENENTLDDIIEKYVYDGLTYVSDVECFFTHSDSKNGLDFDVFWKSASSEISELWFGEKTDVSPSKIDYIKETLRADWDDGTKNVSLYTADLNGDGIDELFICSLIGAGQYGYTYIYDVSAEPKLICDMGLRFYFSSGGIYKDDNDKIHFLSMEHYAGSISEEDVVYYDVTYDDSGAVVKIPFCAMANGWFDGGAHLFDYQVYTDCKYFTPAVKNRNYDLSEGSFVGAYDTFDVWGIESYNDLSKAGDEIKEIIEQSVFDGLTYVSDPEWFHGLSKYDEKEYGRLPFSFNEFWEYSFAAIAEIYADQL